LTTPNLGVILYVVTTVAKYDILRAPGKAHHTFRRFYPGGGESVVARTPLFYFGAAPGRAAAGANFTRRRGMDNKTYMEIMKNYSVESKSVSDFLREYHVRNTIYQENFPLLVADGKKELEEFGFILLPAHISITGRTTTYGEAGR
jgi:hypothetical protein